MRNIFKRASSAALAVAAVASAMMSVSTTAFAQDDLPPPERQPAPVAPRSSKSERLSVQSIKEKYWAKGEEGELRVVQNRLYTKAHRLEIGLFGGNIATDPFLSVKNAGATIGYHFNEYFAINAVGWKDFVNSSSALITLQNTQHVTANTNIPSTFFGGEVAFSPLYGKLSLMGAKIIYLDAHLLGGAGVTKTETGSYITPNGGVGAQIYLNRYMSLRLDYRLTYYKEQIVEKQDAAHLGEIVGSRSNWSNVTTLGLTFLFDL